MMIKYQLIRVQGDTRTELTTDNDLEKVKRLRDLMNSNAPEGVNYVVEQEQRSTRPLPALPE